MHPSIVRIFDFIEDGQGGCDSDGICRWRHAFNLTRVEANEMLLGR